ncbi:MAG: hypothetical protein FWB72_01950 [Firmicutes bacterium]|nr:hypothetical protein [Bacillota bacterium]
MLNTKTKLGLQSGVELCKSEMQQLEGGVNSIYVNAVVNAFRDMHTQQALPDGWTRTRPASSCGLYTVIGEICYSGRVVNGIKFKAVDNVGIVSARKFNEGQVRWTYNFGEFRVGR